MKKFMKSFKNFLKENYSSENSPPPPPEDTLAGNPYQQFETQGDNNSNYAYPIPTSYSPANNTVRQFDKHSDYNVVQSSEIPIQEPPFVEEDMPSDPSDPLWSDPDFLNFIRQLYDLRQNRGNQEWFRARYGEITAENNFMTQIMNLIYSLRWSAWWRYDPVSGRPIRLRIPELNNPLWDQIFK